MLKDTLFESHSVHKLANTIVFSLYLQEAVYNQTVNIVEISEGLDGETFFLYVFLGAACVLALVVGQQALSSLARRRSPRAAPKPLETGTANDVDYDWLPREVVNQLSKYFRQFGMKLLQ